MVWMLVGYLLLLFFVGLYLVVLRCISLLWICVCVSGVVVCVNVD